MAERAEGPGGGVKTPDPGKYVTEIGYPSTRDEPLQVLSSKPKPERSTS